MSNRKTLFIDADSILYSAATICQENTITAVNNLTGEEHKGFSGVRQFKTYCENSGMNFKDFHFIDYARPSEDVSVAFNTIKNKMSSIVQTVKPRDYYVCLEGPGNFRKDRDSEFVIYKGKRKEKPLFYQECHDYMTSRYNSIIAIDEETDDVVNMRAWDSYEMAMDARKKSAAPYIIAYIDKDLVANGRGLYINYNQLDKGVFWVNERYQTYNFALQCLMGDSCDNIPGLKGVGEVSARKHLRGCENEKQLMEKVVEVYKGKMKDRWYECLDDNAFFLYLRRQPNEYFVLSEYLDSLEIKY